MRLHPRFLSSAAAIAIACVVSAAAYFYKSRSTEINEVMVFCKLQYNAYNCFDKLISYVEAARKSVDVCMPGIHNPAIQGRLVTLIKKKNIKVRVIVDRSENDPTDFLLKELIEAGAEIKCSPNSPFYKMQHKFCLVDDKILMTGTLNWGNDLSSDHWNYVYITNKKSLVDPVKREFYQMWKGFPDDFGQTLNNTPSSDSDAETEALISPNSETIDIDIDKVPHTIIESQVIRKTMTTPEVLLA